MMNTEYKEFDNALRNDDVETVENLFDYCISNTGNNIDRNYLYDVSFIGTKDDLKRPDNNIEAFLYYSLIKCCEYGSNKCLDFILSKNILVPFLWSYAVELTQIIPLCMQSNSTSCLKSILEFMDWEILGPGNEMSWTNTYCNDMETYQFLKIFYDHYKVKFTSFKMVPIKDPIVFELMKEITDHEVENLVEKVYSTFSSLQHENELAFDFFNAKIDDIEFEIIYNMKTFKDYPELIDGIEEEYNRRFKNRLQQELSDFDKTPKIRRM